MASAEPKKEGPQLRAEFRATSEDAAEDWAVIRPAAQRLRAHALVDNGAPPSGFSQARDAS